MEQKIKNVAILGCSKMAHLHARAVVNLPQTRLAGVWSRTDKSAEDFASLYGVPAYSDISALMVQESIDVAIVCTAHPFHLEPTLLAAAHGVHVLVEKPLASTLEDCDRMIEACKQANVSLGVVSQRRWYQPVLRMKEAINAGKIGKPALGVVTCWVGAIVPITNRRPGVESGKQKGVVFWSIRHPISSIFCCG